ncbi:MAG TPA: PHB depolymerase family esterase [Actinophytocola sp.]|nr:PHB depolymerase family esterase [Actinophytocola sp.]
MALLTAITAPAYAAGGAYFSGVYANLAGVRDYHGYVPSSYRPGTPMPLLVALHGCTENDVGFDLLSGWSALAEERGFIVVFPDQSNLANPAGCWNWPLPVNQHRGQGEPSIIAGITNKIRSQYSVDSRRVFTTGVSADRIAGQWAVVDGIDAVPDEVAHGQVPAGRSYTHLTYRSAAGRSLIEQYMIDGAGHAYPGGCSCSLYGDPAGPDASTITRDFFLANPKT